MVFRKTPKAPVPSLVLLNSFQARYLLVNATLLVVSVFALLGEVLGFYETGRIGRVVMISGMSLFSVNVLGSLVRVVCKAICILTASSPASSVVATPVSNTVTNLDKPHGFLEKHLEEKEENVRYQQQQQQQRLGFNTSPTPSPIRLISTPGKTIESPTAGSSAQKSGMSMGPSTPFTLRMAAASSPKRLVSAPVNEEFKVTEIEPQASNKKPDAAVNASLAGKASVVGTVYKGEEALRYLGISYERLDVMTDNLRVWFSRKILVPLQKNIQECEEHFAKAGWSHLGPAHPAVYSLLPNQHHQHPSGSWERGFVIPPTLGSSSSNNNNNAAAGKGISSLLELAQMYKGDPMVTLRLSIEKYLDTGIGIAGHRSMTLQRIKQLAADPWIRVNSNENSAVSSLLMHLFCCFLDENLEMHNNEVGNQQQPLSSRNFVALGEPEGSFAAGTPKLQQIGPQLFRVLLPNNTNSHVVALEMPPGMNHLLHVLVLFLEHIRIRLHGYLGMSNLASPRLQLMQVLQIGES